jgi:hypothetical protein
VGWVTSDFGFRMAWPSSGYDFINILLSLPISIYYALYLQGGPEVNLYFSVNGFQFERIGRYATHTESDT